MAANQRIVGPKAQVKCCGDRLQSLHQHDFVRCQCGRSFIDGGSAYTRFGGHADDFEWIEDELYVLNENGLPVRREAQ